MAQFLFDEKEHVYTLDGKRLTGVTTILDIIAKPALIQWAANMAVKYIKENAVRFLGTDEIVVHEHTLEEAKTAHKKKKEDAGTKGTNIHKEIENLINTWIKENNGYAIPSISLQRQIQDFINWSHSNNVRYLASERRLYSKTHWYAGTADIMCEIDSKRYVGDIKTSSAIYPEYFIQASAYAQGLVEMGEQRFDGVVVINCKRDGGFEYKYNFDVDGNFRCFLAALTLYRQLRAIDPNQK